MFLGNPMEVWQEAPAQLWGPGLRSWGENMGRETEPNLLLEVGPCWVLMLCGKISGASLLSLLPSHTVSPFLQTPPLLLEVSQQNWKCWFYITEGERWRQQQRGGYPSPSLCAHTAQALEAARVGAGSWPGRCENKEGRSKRVRLWGCWRRAWAHSPCNEPRREVKSGGHHSGLPAASHNLALCRVRREEELGDVWVGLALAEWHAMAVHLPCPACVLNPCVHPNDFAPGSATAPHCPPCSIAASPLHPPQSCSAGLQSQALQSWELSSTIQQLITCSRLFVPASFSVDGPSLISNDSVVCFLLLLKCVALCPAHSALSNLSSKRNL